MKRSPYPRAPYSSAGYLFSAVVTRVRSFLICLRCLLNAALYFGKSPAEVTGPALILFPYRQAVVCCGLAGIVAYKAADTAAGADIPLLAAMVRRADARCTAGITCLCLGAGPAAELRLPRLADAG